MSKSFQVFATHFPSLECGITFPAATHLFEILISTFIDRYKLLNMRHNSGFSEVQWKWFLIFKISD